MRIRGVSDIRLLIIGGDGAIGGALVNAARARDLPFAATTRRQRPSGPGMYFFDLKMDAETLPFHTTYENAAAVLCASVASLAECRNFPDNTYHINVTRVCDAARTLSGRGFRPVFLSTNLVFDGIMPLAGGSTTPNPRSEYGRQKYEAEKRLAEISEQSLIIRLSKVIGPSFPLFRNWLESWRKGEAVEAFGDVVFSPVTLDLAVAGILALTLGGECGIRHLSGHDEMSYADAAYALAGLCEVSDSLVKPVPAPLSIPEEHRPRHTSLDSTAIARYLGIAAPSSRDALEWFAGQNKGKR